MELFSITGVRGVNINEEEGIAESGDLWRAAVCQRVVPRSGQVPYASAANRGPHSEADLPTEGRL